MTFIWVARGRSWGFQFLRRGGFPDPLLIYEAVFDQLDLGNEGYQRVGMRGALRLADPRDDPTARVAQLPTTSSSSMTRPRVFGPSGMASANYGLRCVMNTHASGSFRVRPSSFHTGTEIVFATVAHSARTILSPERTSEATSHP